MAGFSGLTRFFLGRGKNAPSAKPGTITPGPNSVLIGDGTPLLPGPSTTLLTATPPPDTQKAGSDAAAAAKLAQDRTRKRAQASTILTAPPLTGELPKVKLQKATLLGS